MITPKFRARGRLRTNTSSNESSESSFDVFPNIKHEVSDLFGSKFFPARSETTIFENYKNNVDQDETKIFADIVEEPFDNQKYAQFRLKQALGLYQLNDSFQKLKFIDSFIFSYPFKIIGLILTLLQCSLALIEPVSIWWSHSNNTQQPNGYKISLYVSSIIELCIIGFHCITIFGHFYRKNSINNVSWMWYFIAILTSFCIISVSCSLCWNEYLRFHRMIRPLFFNLYWMHGIWCLEIILMTVMAVTKPFIIALSSITIFSFVVYSMFCDNSLELHGNPKMQQLKVKNGFIIPFICYCDLI